MRVLGIHSGHDASIAIAEDGRIIFAVEEERLTGIKKFAGFPMKSWVFGCRYLGIGQYDFDKVVFSQKSNFFFRPTGVLYVEHNDLFRDATYCDHHYAHAVSAYSWSGFGDCVVMTLDGGGDSLFATIYEAKGGKLNLVATNSHVDKYPFGLFYNQVTATCGFQPNRHEGKVMGLAAHGNPNGMFDGLFWVDGTQINSTGEGGQYEVESLVEKRLVALPRDKPLYMIDVAASAQKVFEDIVIEWVEKNAKGRDLAVAGGCFANVLANMKIARLVNRLFVCPPMFDAGLAVGAALSVFDPLPSYKVKDVYLGFSSQVRPENMHPPQVVAEALAEGKIVGLLQGRMEFGPRALGNRTILADARNPDMMENLNKKLSRTEFMPFAPVILEEFADEILIDYEHGKDCAPFMTNCWSVKDEWKARIPAVVHIDGTARPQVLSEEVNPYYYSIVAEYYKLTGVPVLINTSFNPHEEPIVCFRNEAEWALRNRRIDILAEA